MMTSKIEKQVNKCIALSETQAISKLQNALHELYNNFNKPNGGQLIKHYSQKDLLGDCFTKMLHVDWTNDTDFREVCAENGFYCIIDYWRTNVKTEEEQISTAYRLFILLNSGGGDSLIPKLNNVLQKNKVLLRDNMFANYLGEAHPHNVFDDDDFAKGGGWLVDQFSFWAAQTIKPLVLNCEVFQGSLLDDFHNILSIKELNQYKPEVIMSKAKFVASIIGSILDDM